MPRTSCIRVNDRDVGTLAALGEYGVLDRGLCHALCFADHSPEWCRQNLARLAAAGLIRTTTLQVWHDVGRPRGGRVPILYSLSEAGAEIVAARTGRPPRRVLRSSPSPATLWHRLQVASVRAAFDRAARGQLPPPSWILEQDLNPDAPKHAMPQHRRLLYHEFTEDGATVTCRPDAAALLTIPHPSGEASRATALAIHFEIDRSSEGVAQCHAKAAGYRLLYERQAYRRYWSALRNPVHRVFWVVPSRQRVESLCAAFRAEPVAASFRFATFDDCRPDRVLTQPVWCDLQRNPMTLYRPSGTPP